MQQKGQGAIEYLLIIGAAILIVAITVIAITSVVGTGQGTAKATTTDYNSALKNLQTGGNATAPSGTATVATTMSAFSGTSGSNGWYTSNGAITLSCTATGTNACKSISYALNGGTIQTVNGSTAVVAIGSTDANNRLDYYSTDTADLVESTKTAFIPIETGSPNITINGFSCGARNVNPPWGDIDWNVNYNATSVSGISSCTTSPPFHYATGFNGPNPFNLTAWTFNSPTNSTNVTRQYNQFSGTFYVLYVSGGSGVITCYDNAGKNSTKAITNTATCS